MCIINGSLLRSVKSFGTLFYRNTGISISCPSLKALLQPLLPLFGVVIHNHCILLYIIVIMKEVSNYWPIKREDGFTSTVEQKIL